MSKSFTAKKFITLSCEAIETLSKNDARDTYKSIKENRNPIWSKFNQVSNALSDKVELNEQIEELEEEIDDNPDEKQKYITQINDILSSKSTIKLIYDLEIGFNKKPGTFGQISDNYTVNITQLQNYKPTTPKKTKQTPKKKEKKQTPKTKTKTKKPAKTTKNNSTPRSKKLPKQKSVNSKNSNKKLLPKQKSVKNGNKKFNKRKSFRLSSTTESTSQFKRKSKQKTDKSKNLSPSQAKRGNPRLRRSSTDEDIKNGKVKKKKNQKNQKDKKPKKSPKSPQSASVLTPTSPKSPASPAVSATQVYNEYGDEKRAYIDSDTTDGNESTATDDSDSNSHVSKQSQDMSSAFAMFEKLSSPKISNGNGFFSSPPTSPTSPRSPRSPTQRVTKKGKRYFDFKSFSSGAFSKVYKAKDKENNDKRVAVKKIHIGGNRTEKGFEPTTKEEGDNEVRILKLLNEHSNTCNLVETYFDMKLGINSGYVLCIVMEYMSYTLKDRMDYYGEKGACIPYHLIKIYLFQLCKAVHWMHIKNVCHRDIKPENVLINIHTNTVQLCDFGCSIVLGKNEYNNDEKYEYQQNHDGNETYVMSRFYRAPELIMGNKFYDCSADMWSLGVVISELFLGTILFMGSSNFDQLREIILKLGWPSKQQIKDMNPSLTKFDKIEGVYGVDSSTMGDSFNMTFMAVMDMEESAIDLISKILVYSPEERITAGKCLTHEYFGKVKSLMNKSNKKRKNASKNKKKMKKEDIVPNDLFDWNEIEIQYAKSKNIKLRK